MSSQARWTRLMVPLLVLVAVLMVEPRILHASPAPECTLPGISLGVDPAGDTDPQLGTADVDIREVLMSQATSSPGPSTQLVVTMKVDQLDPNNLPPNRVWRVIWKNPSDNNAYFVSMTTCDIAHSPSFDHGWLDPATGIQTSLGSAQGSLGNDGTIQITVPRSVIGNPQTGAVLDSIVGDTRFLAGAQCTGNLRQLDQLFCSTYTISDACAGPPPPPQSRCIVPGLTVGEDPVGDATGTEGSTPADDIVSLSVAEPWYEDLRERITFTIKVAEIDPSNPPLDRQWFMYFIAPTDPETTFFVSVRTCGATTPATGPAFGFGFISTGTNNLRAGLGNCFGRILPTGELQVVMPKDTIGTNTTTGMVHWHVPVGTNIFGIQGFSYLLAGANCTGLLEPFDQADAALEYTVTGNQYCEPYAMSCPPDFGINDQGGAGRDTTIHVTIENPSTATRTVNVNVADGNGWIMGGTVSTAVSVAPGATASVPVALHVPGGCTPSETDVLTFQALAPDLPAPGNQQECSTTATCLAITTGVDGDGPRALSFTLRGPNPAHDRTQLAFSIPSRSPIKIEVFTLTGQRVRTLLDGVHEAGSYTVPFDLRDARGKRIGSGVYLVRITTAHASKTLRVVGIH